MAIHPPRQLRVLYSRVQSHTGLSANCQLLTATLLTAECLQPLASSPTRMDCFGPKRWRRYADRTTSFTPATLAMRKFALGRIAPVTVVRGNVDRDPWARKLPLTNALEVEELSIYVIHSLAELDLKPEAAGFAAVVSGHSHMPRQETKRGVLYFNPGSAGPKRFRLPVSLGLLYVQGGSIRGELMTLKV